MDACWLLCIFVLAGAAEIAFRNLRNKYGKIKKKWSAANKSGAGAKDVMRPPLLDMLGWLEPYIAERKTSTNWQCNFESIIQDSDEEEATQQREQGKIDVEDGDDEYIRDNESTVSSNSVTTANHTLDGGSVNKGKDNNKKSGVTGKQKFEKGANKRKADLETDLMYKIRDKLNSDSNTKDDDQLYCDLLATKLRKLTRISKLKAKHEIDNLMFKYQLEDEVNTVPLYQPAQTNSVSLSINQPITMPNQEVFLGCN